MSSLGKCLEEVMSCVVVEYFEGEHSREVGYARQTLSRLYIITKRCCVMLILYFGGGIPLLVKLKKKAFSTACEVRVVNL